MMCYPTPQTVGLVLSVLLPPAIQPKQKPEGDEAAYHRRGCDGDLNTPVHGALVFCLGYYVRRRSRHLRTGRRRG